MQTDYKILIINHSNLNKLIPMISNFSWDYQNNVINLKKFCGYEKSIIITSSSDVVSGIRDEISIFLFELIETEKYNEEIIKKIDSVIIIFDENAFSNESIEKVKLYKPDMKIIIFNNKTSSDNKNKINQFEDISEIVFDISLKTGEGIKKGLVNMINYFVNLNSLYREYEGTKN